MGTKLTNLDVTVGSLASSSCITVGENRVYRKNNNLLYRKSYSCK